MFNTMEKCGVSTVLAALTIAMLSGGSLGLPLIAAVGILVWALSYGLYSL
jgi:hypothetical protein